MKSYVAILFTVFSFSACAQVGGIGVKLKIDTLADGSTIPRIQNVLPDNPAAAMGIKEGWYVIKVSGVSCHNMSLDELVVRMRGDTGTKLELLLADSPQGGNAAKYMITRAQVKVPPGDAVDTLDAFYKHCKRVAKDQGYTILDGATFSCADSSFTFAHDKGFYMTRCFLMEEKSMGKKPYDISVFMYTDPNEEDHYSLYRTPADTTREVIFSELGGGRWFEGPGEFIIQVKTSGELSRCKGVCLMAYKL